MPMMARSVRRFITGRIYDCIRFRSNATIVYFLADIREESIYAMLGDACATDRDEQLFLPAPFHRHLVRVGEEAYSAIGGKPTSARRASTLLSSSMGSTTRRPSTTGNELPKRCG